MVATALLDHTDEFTSDQLHARTYERRAVEAAIWGMPIVSVEAMRRGFFELGANYGDILYLSKPADWRLQLTTPNASSHYVYLNFTVKDGPVVLDIPAAVGAGLFGSILDAWQVPLADVGVEGDDEGRGGRYLLVPPAFADDPPAGFLPVHLSTFNGYVALRAIPRTRGETDTALALGLIRKTSVYPFSQVDDPPQQRHIDIAGTLFDGIAGYDDTFYDSLARMVDEEPVLKRDLVAMAMLRTIGIEKGKPFTPDEEHRAILRKAIAEAHASFVEATTNVVPYWPNAKWGTPACVEPGAKTTFTYEMGGYLDVDNRGALFFAACALPRKLGAASFYLFGALDAANTPLDGSRTYRLHVPPNVPAKQFWAVTVYDVDSCAFICESPKVEVNSYQQLQKNTDGSVDVYLSNRAPAGKESNWIYTARGKRWMAAFRFYGPTTAIHDKSWVLPDIEEVKTATS